MWPASAPAPAALTYAHAQRTAAATPDGVRVATEQAKRASVLLFSSAINTRAEDADITTRPAEHFEPRT